MKVFFIKLFSLCLDEIWHTEMLLIIFIIRSEDIYWRYH